MKEIKNGQNSRTDYTIHKTLLKHLDERLHIEKKYEKFKKAGGEWLPEDAKKRKRLERMKVHILDKHVFRSMANLTVFLEYMATSPYLNDIFEEDLKALFLAKSTSTIIKVDRLKRYSIFARFTGAACRLMEDKSKAINKKDDFRVILCDMMQESVYRAMSDIGELKFPHEGDKLFLGKTLYVDMDRAFAWTHMLAEEARKRLVVDEERRPPLF